MVVPAFRRPAVENELRLRDKDEFDPSWSEKLSTLFEFATGVSVANLLILLLATRFVGDVKAFAILEAGVMFGVFGLLIVLSRVSPLAHTAEGNYAADDLSEAVQTGRANALGAVIGLVLGAAVGTALGVGFSIALSGVLGRPVHGLADNLMGGALFGALIAMVAGGVLTLAGGTPDWKAGRLFTATGALVPAMLRKLLFPKANQDIRVPARPWLEAVVWLGFIAGPIAWFLSQAK